MQRVSRSPTVARKNHHAKSPNDKLKGTVPRQAKTAPKFVQPGSHKPVTLAPCAFLERGKIEDAK